MVTRNDANKGILVVNKDIDLIKTDSNKDLL